MSITPTYGVGTVTAPEEVSDGRFDLVVKWRDQTQQVQPWQQAQDSISAALRKAGLRQAVSSELFGGQIDRHWHTGIVIAPGILVSQKEYEERYQSVDLEALRQSMSPELYKVFVRYLGVIPGNPNIDVNELASSVG